MKTSYLSELNYIVAETDDLIVDYCIEKEELEHVAIKSKDPRYNHGLDRKRRYYMEDCDDDTAFLKTSHREHLQNIELLIAHVKRLIKKIKNRKTAYKETRQQ